MTTKERGASQELLAKPNDYQIDERLLAEVINLLGIPLHELKNIEIKIVESLGGILGNCDELKVKIATNPIRGSWQISQTLVHELVHVRQFLDQGKLPLHEKITKRHAKNLQMIFVFYFVPTITVLRATQISLELTDISSQYEAIINITSQIFAVTLGILALIRQKNKYYLKDPLEIEARVVSAELMLKYPSLANLVSTKS